MKKMFILAYVVTALFAVQCRAELPVEWTEQADRILAATSGITEALNAETEMFQSLRQSIASVAPLVNEANAVRDEIFARVREKIYATQSAVDNIAAELSALRQEADLEKTRLNGQIMDVTNTSSQDIANLTSQSDALTAQISELQALYSTDVGEYEAKATELLNQLNAIGSAYDGAAIEREAFIGELNQMLADVDNDNLNDKVKLSEIKNEICITPPAEVNPEAIVE